VTITSAITEETQEEPEPEKEISHVENKEPEVS
jgi:hypothetical protein